MARKSKRASHRHRRSRRSRLTRGGVAPIHHSDGGWSSKMSLGQGGDYLKFHAGQHGGAGVSLQGADISVIGGEGLPSALRGAALLGGQDRALGAISGMSDQFGGRRRSRRKSHGRKRKSHGGKRKSHGGKRKSYGGKRKSHGRKRRHTRRRGGGHSMGYAPVGSPSMLLESPSQYIQGGLSNEWNGPEVDAARARAAL